MRESGKPLAIVPLTPAWPSLPVSWPAPTTQRPPRPSYHLSLGCHHLGDVPIPEH